MAEKASFFSLTLAELAAFLQAQGQKPHAAAKAFAEVYRQHNFDPASWQGVAKASQSLISQSFSFDLPQIISYQQSQDGTIKFLMAFSDGHNAETVYIPVKERRTLCLSSQVGCLVGCTFCHTATQGFVRHLQIEEVVGQLLAASLWLQQQMLKPVSNLVYMGQGEPLHNFARMKTATEIFMENVGAGFGGRKITLSTSGLVPQVEKLAEFPPVNIAISLHAVDNATRSSLMPANRVYDLERLFAALGQIPLRHKQRITYEYLLIDGVNNRQEDLDALERLLDKSRSKINLISFNEYPGSIFRRPPLENVLWFNGELNRRGFTSTIRPNKGEDILAACGQLKSQVDEAQAKKKNSLPAASPCAAS